MTTRIVDVRDRRDLGRGGFSVLSRPLFLCLVLFSLIPSCFGLITKLRLKDDVRSAIHLSTFGYDEGGVMRIQMHQYEFNGIYGRLHDPGHKIVSFVLERSTSDLPVRLNEDETTEGAANKVHWEAVEIDGKETMQKKYILDQCFHTDKQRNDDDVYIALSSPIDASSLNYNYTITEPGYYHLYLSNCEPHTSISLSLTLTQYNLLPDGSIQYLSSGERYLPSIYLMLAVFFSVAAVAWGLYLLMHSEHVKRIHWLMLAVVSIKAATLITQSLQYHSLKQTGVEDGWTIAYYILSSLKGLFLFCVIILLSTGYSYLTPFLSDRAKRFLLFSLILQALLSLCSVIVHELSPAALGWERLKDIVVVLDLLGWCLILIPIGWSIRTIHQQIEGEKQREELAAAARNLSRLKAFRSFYLLVLCFIYVSRIITFVLTLTLPFELVWVSTVFAETAALAFYALTAILFRPITDNPYAALEGEEAEENGEGEDEEGEEEFGALEEQVHHHDQQIQMTTLKSSMDGEEEEPELPVDEPEPL